jgi:hypothetical protein
MNSNLFHNISNIAIVIVAMATAGLLASGCTTLPTGLLECSQSWIDPIYTTVAVGALGVLKVVVNIARDGLTGLTKPQPPVQK